MQKRQERGVTWHRCAPPTRTIRFCYRYLCTGYSPVPDVLIRRDTRSGAIDAFVYLEARDTSPTTLVRETRGSHGSRMIVSQSATGGFDSFGVAVSCPSVCLLIFSYSVSMSLSRVSPRVCCVLRRSDAYLYNVIISHPPK